MTMKRFLIFQTERRSAAVPHLEEVLDALWVVAVALAADALHLFDLARLAGRLDVLEVDLGVLAEVHDGAQEIEQACGTSKGL